MKHGKSLFILALSLPTLFSCGNKPAPKPEIIYYDITFNANGGEIISGETSIRVAAGTTFEQCEKPIAKLDGKVFQYWTFDQEGTKAVGDNFRIDNNYDLFANYYTEGTLHFEQPEDSSIVTYGSTGIAYSGALDDVSVTSSDQNIITFEHDYEHSYVYLDAASSNVQGESTITISDGVSSDSIVMSVHYPTTIQEAAESVDFSLARKVTDISITFNYDNQENFSDFVNSRLETRLSIDLNNAYAYWNLGSNKTNHLILPLSTTMATKSKDISKAPYQNVFYYENLKNVAYELRHSKIERRTDNHFAIDDAKKRLVVHNSEALFFALERGFRPVFESSEIAVTGSVAQRAYQVYQKAREACAEAFGTETTDNFAKVRQLYEWLVNNTHYDHWIVSEYATEVENFWEWSSYFPEGVFLNNGIAVCDGFSKALAIMGGIEGLPVIRSGGYTLPDSEENVNGHAWNYYKHSDDKWYLICPTWSHDDYDSGSFINYNFSGMSYQPFMAESNYFYNHMYLLYHNLALEEGYNEPTATYIADYYAQQSKFSDDYFSSIAKSETPYVSDIYTTDKFDTIHDYDYRLDTNEEADALVEAISDLDLSGNFSVDVSFANECVDAINHFLDGLRAEFGQDDVALSQEYTYTHVMIFVKN